MAIVYSSGFGEESCSLGAFKLAVLTIQGSLQQSDNFSPGFLLGVEPVPQRLTAVLTVCLGDVGLSDVGSWGLQCFLD